jgi:hypothetical protein
VGVRKVPQGDQARRLMLDIERQEVSCVQEMSSAVERERCPHHCNDVSRQQHIRYGIGQPIAFMREKMLGQLQNVPESRMQKGISQQQN